jgi:hypothetical protein
VERPLVPSGILPLGVLAARTLIEREARLTLGSPAGQGEIFEASWRWWTHRPRVSVSFSTPSPTWGIGTIWRLHAFYDRQTYHPGVDVEEVRRGATFSATDWLDGHWRWELGAGVDRWRGAGTTARFDASLARRSSDDRWIATAAGSMYAGAVETGTVSAAIGWRSAARQMGMVWHGRAGFDFAGDAAPLALWPGAGTGHARQALLRAHPLLDDGIVRGGVFGRRLAHAGLELRRWIRPSSRPWRIAPALFVDVAHAARAGTGFDERLHADAGVGLRFGVPGGAIRVDVGRGLRDGAMAVSAGWTR